MDFVVVLKSGCDDATVAMVAERVAALGFVPHVSKGLTRTIVAVTGGVNADDQEQLEQLAAVDHVVGITAPHKLSSRAFHEADTLVEVGGVKLGGGYVTLIAGPCTVESRDMLLETAALVKSAGAALLRGGAYKPRTSPYSFTGLGREGLALLREASQTLKIPSVTEVMDPREVEWVADHVDMLQIGARNMQNYNLLLEVGRTAKPVLLKRGFSATLSELLMSAEYIMGRGNHQVVLCERGIRTFNEEPRFTLDISAVPLLREKTHLPVIVDPSHAAGKRDLVPALALAAIAAGAHGIMVEVHARPEQALCDGPQALLPATFARLAEQIREMASLLGRRISR